MCDAIETYTLVTDGRRTLSKISEAAPVRSMDSELSRRQILRTLGRPGATTLAGNVVSFSQAAQLPPIRNVLVSVNENRSFDHYYGKAPFVGSYGIPAGYSQPDGIGGRVTPILFSLRKRRIPIMIGPPSIRNGTAVRWMDFTPQTGWPLYRTTRQRHCPLLQSVQ